MRIKAGGITEIVPADKKGGAKSGTTAGGVKGPATATGAKPKDDKKEKPTAQVANKEKPAKDDKAKDLNAA